MDYRTPIQQFIYFVINPLIKGMIRIGITPNIITTIGLLGNIAAMAMFLGSARYLEDGQTRQAFSLIGWGGAVILFA